MSAVLVEDEKEEGGVYTPGEGEVALSLTFCSRSFYFEVIPQRTREIKTEKEKCFRASYHSSKTTTCIVICARSAPPLLPAQYTRTSYRCYSCHQQSRLIHELDLVASWEKLHISKAQNLYPTISLSFDIEST